MTESCILFPHAELDQVGKSNYSCTFDEVHILELVHWTYFLGEPLVVFFFFKDLDLL